jgi:hypothetical protein
MGFHAGQLGQRPFPIIHAGSSVNLKFSLFLRDARLTLESHFNIINHTKGMDKKPCLWYWYRVEIQYTSQGRFGMDMSSYWHFGIVWMLLAGSFILSTCYIKNKQG